MKYLITFERGWVVETDHPLSKEQVIEKALDQVNEDRLDETHVTKIEEL